ncbi:MAG TPA: response regulator [Chthoniobacteraceae bacterium]|nr:response regulator [Chthoniobacteraceae bacterium]
MAVPILHPEPKRILLAEDHHVSRHLLERNLSNWGFQVLTAADGEGALRILQGENPPALAVLDWTMPKMDGLEVCRRIRARADQPYTYLLLLTARSHKDEIAEALAAGVDDYIIKPFDSEELRARLSVGRRVVALERTLAAREEELRVLRAEKEARKG